MLEKFYNKLIDAFVGVLSLIPVPDWLTNTSFDLHPYVAWAFSILNIQAGAAIVLSAYLIRFTIRRIPVIG